MGKTFRRNKFEDTKKYRSEFRKQRQDKRRLKGHGDTDERREHNKWDKDER